MSASKKYDLIVIGVGSGGVRAAKIAAIHPTSAEDFVTLK
jgi:pyruvate/2-oxoglutarate dehydrogenase complex dihydrolipoamide dehydrogenase (E3) component